MARFKRPGFTQIPNEIFDELMPQLTGAEFKVLCLIARKTFGFHKECESMSLAAVVAGTGLSKQGAHDSIHSLEKQNFIVKSGGTFSGIVSPCAYSLAVDDLVNSPDQELVNSVDLRKTDLVNSVDLVSGQLSRPDLVNSVDQPIRKKENLKEIEEKKEEDNLRDPSLFSENQNPSEPENSGDATDLQTEEPRFAPKSTSDLMEGDDVCTFVKRAYSRRRRIKLKSADLKKRQARMEKLEEESGDDFREGLWNYLDTESDWHRDNQWPIDGYLKNPLKYFSKEPSSARTVTAMQSRAASSSQHGAPETQTPQSASNRQIENPSCNYVYIWDSIVCVRPAGTIPGWLAKKIESSQADLDEETFRNVCEKCKRIIDAGGMEGVDFKWLWAETKSGPNWQQVILGKFNWAERSKVSKPEREMTPTERLIAKARAKKEAEQRALSQSST